MNKEVFAGIEAKARELEATLFRLNGKEKIDEMIQKMKSGYQLASLSSLYSQGSVFDPILPRTLDPATSGFSSDCYEVIFINSRMTIPWKEPIPYPSPKLRTY